MTRAPVAAARSSSNATGQPDAAVKLQLLSDLHLETEDFHPQPAPGAELLILGGDIDSTWQGLSLFRGWPVPVVMVQVISSHKQCDSRQ